MSKKYVYLFREGKASMKDLLGGKGANLCEMTNIGLLVPPGFTITTEVCNENYTHGKNVPEGTWDQAWSVLSEIEAATGKIFGDKKNPLLVSIRSGAKFSMLDMMGAVLNLRLNDETVKVLTANTQNGCFDCDCYRCFIQMLGDVILEVEQETAKENQVSHNDTELPSIHINIHLGIGDFVMNKNEISGNFSNAKFGDNTSIQSREITQSNTNTVTNEFPNVLFEDLKSEIINLIDQDEKTDSLENVLKIQKAIKTGNIERAKKIFGWLPGIIRTSAAAITIAKTFGFCDSAPPIP